jgi:hypothetical protein
MQHLRRLDMAIAEGVTAFQAARLPCLIKKNIEAVCVSKFEGCLFRNTM